MKYFRWIALGLSAFLLSIWLGSCFAAPPSPVINLNFAGAGMARRALQEIETLYQQTHPTVVINSIFAGSGVVKAAIERGEPYDGVFFAELDPLTQLQAQGLILPGSRQEMVTTDVVLIARRDFPLQLTKFQDLTNDRVKRVAIGRENLAIGRYTQRLLTALGIQAAVSAKAVVQKVDVREVLRAVEEGEADVGITFLPEAKSSDQVKVLATAPRDSYPSVSSVAAVIKTSKHPQTMQDYLTFLTGEPARVIFEKYGLYRVPA